MTDARAKSSDLKKNGVIRVGRTMPDPPVSVIADQLTQLSGPELEITTRSNPQLVKAAAIGYVFSSRFDSAFVRGRIEQIERLAESEGGQGRRDLIDALEAGGRLPEAYYTGVPSSGGKQEMRYIREDDDE